MDDDSARDFSPPASLPLALANTVKVRRGRPTDEIDTVEGFGAWLDQADPTLAASLPRELGEAELREAHVLREAVRGVFAAVVEGREPEAEEMERLNEFAAAAPFWPELRWQGGLASVRRTAAEPVTAALAEVAAAAIELVASEESADLAACASPECCCYLVRDDPRRKWCSPSCGNRVRVNRHYRKGKD